MSRRLIALLIALYAIAFAFGAMAAIRWPSLMMLANLVLEDEAAVAGISGIDWRQLGIMYGAPYFLAALCLYAAALSLGNKNAAPVSGTPWVSSPGFHVSSSSISNRAGGKTQARAKALSQAPPQGPSCSASPFGSSAANPSKRRNRSFKKTTANPKSFMSKRPLQSLKRNRSASTDVRCQLPSRDSAHTLLQRAGA